MMSPRTVYRTCTLCEANCVLSLEVEENRIVSMRRDDEDVFSHGYVCPKSVSIADVHHDPGCPIQPRVTGACSDSRHACLGPSFRVSARASARQLNP